MTASALGQLREVLFLRQETGSLVQIGFEGVFMPPTRHQGHLLGLLCP